MNIADRISWSLLMFLAVVGAASIGMAVLGRPIDLAGPLGAGATVACLEWLKTASGVVSPFRGDG